MTIFTAKLRDNSVVSLSEVGEYIGTDAILEYTGFAVDEISPFLDVGPKFKSGFFRVLGLNEESGQCEFLLYSLFAQEFNPAFSEQDPATPTRLLVSSMNKTFLDYSESFISRANIFYRKPYLKHYFEHVFNTATVRDFVCNDVLRDECNVDVTTCRTDLDSLPLSDGDGDFDGNSFGCRVFSHPTAHRAHVTLDPDDLDEATGKLRCSQSLERSPLDLFDQKTIDAFGEWEHAKDIDPELGFKEIDQL